MNKNQLGHLGEKVASDTLKKKGYRILDKNYRCRSGEIDIIALKGNTLVFVEVRSKISRSFGSPEESITIEKQNRLKAAAMDYYCTRSNLPDNWRIDLVAIEFDAPSHKASRIEIIENITG